LRCHKDRKELSRLGSQSIDELGGNDLRLDKEFEPENGFIDLFDDDAHFG